MLLSLEKSEVAYYEFAVVCFTMTPSYSVVSALTAAMWDQFVLALNEKGEKTPERIDSFTRT